MIEREKMRIRYKEECIMQNRSLRSWVEAALMAAVLAVCSQIQIPLEMVPINLALFTVHLSAGLLGWLYGGISVALYLLLAAVGVPVLAGYKGGLGAITGVTGGYLIGYLLAVLIEGFLLAKFVFKAGNKVSAPVKYILCAAVLVLGTLVCYAFGTAWFIQMTGKTLAVSLGACVLPFLPGDGVKIALATVLLPQFRKALAALLPE